MCVYFVCFDNIFFNLESSEKALFLGSCTPPAGLCRLNFLHEQYYFVGPQISYMHVHCVHFTDTVGRIEKRGDLG